MAGARMRRPTAPKRLLEHHARDLIDALGRLYRAPVASLLTASVIGITLALPAGLHVLLKSVDALSYDWHDSVEASLFLERDTAPEVGRDLAQQLAERPDIKSTGYISREQALAEFKRRSGFGKAIKALDHNPLPAVITVQPAPSLTTAEIDALIQKLEAKPVVDKARLDQAWLKRLYAIVEVAKRVMVLIAVLLGLAVIFIVGNTIRLDIENRREQIEVMKLLGASDGFVRRPFLYSGFWYGLAGGVLAWLILTICLLVLSGPVQRLAGLYGNDIGLLWVGGSTSLLVVIAGIGLGWLGSAWTVHRHLRRIQPT